MVAQGIRSGFAMVLALLLWGMITPALQAQPASSATEWEKDLELLNRASKARAGIVRRVSPAVVHISVQKTISETPNQPPNPFMDEEFMRRFFGNRFPPSEKREREQHGLGSGLLVDTQGHILTNNHVIASAEHIVVKLKSGEEFEASLVGADPASDLAVLKIEGQSFPMARLGDSEALEVGETVIAIGNPFGLEQTVTLGILSAKGRSEVGVADYEDFLQTDAPINPGNSGGPLVNLRGEVVGINTAIFRRMGSNLGIGFAIPINMAQRIMSALINQGHVVRGFLGIHLQNVTPDLAEALGVNLHSGVLVTHVMENTPASRAGLRKGDIITEFNAHPIPNLSNLRNRVAATEPGASVEVGLLREGKPKRVLVKVGTQPSQTASATRPQSETAEEPQAEDDAPEEALGFRLGTLTAERAAQLGYVDLRGALVLEVDPRGTAHANGLRAGALILEADLQPITDVAALRKVLQEANSGDSLLLLTRMGPNYRFFALKLP